MLLRREWRLLDGRADEHGKKPTSNDMITAKDLYDIIGNKVAGDAQKSIIRNGLQLEVSEQLCDAIDREDKTEHLRRCLIE